MEEKREEQRKEDNIQREQLHRDDIQRMEKLEERRDTQWAADLLASKQVMMKKMQNMFQQSNMNQQSQPPNPLVQLRLPFPPIARTSSNQASITSTGMSHSESVADDLAESLDKTNLETVDSAKKQKTTDDMHLVDDHSHSPPHPGRQQ